CRHLWNERRKKLERKTCCNKADASGGMKRMKITISGPAAAYASDSEDEITGAEALRGFSGVRSAATCVDYLDESLGRIGLIGGFLEFVFDETDQRLRIRTEYHSPRELKPREIARLVEQTRAQWS